jgi:hypothetical protein
MDAINGFAVQALVSLAESLGVHGWDAVSVEPTATNGSEIDKVDIEWLLDDVAVRHAQVKNSRNKFTPKKVREWADEVSSASAAPVRELLLVGPGTFGRGHPQVSVRHIGTEQTLHDAIASRLAKAFEKMGLNPSPSAVDMAARETWKELLFESRRSRTWSRVELDGLLRRGLEPKDGPDLSCLRFHLFRTVLLGGVDASAFTDDFLAWEVRNVGCTPVNLGAYRMTVADLGVCELLAYGDGRKQNPHAVAGHSSGAGRFELTMQVREPIEPGEQRWLGMHVRRGGGVTALGDMLIYQDPLCPLNEPSVYQCTHEVAFPKAGEIVGTSPAGETLGNGVVRWEARVGLEQVVFGASLRPDNADGADGHPSSRRAASDRAFSRMRQILGASE